MSFLNDILAGLWALLILALAVDACVHQPPTTAQATTQTTAASGAQTGSASGTQAQAASAAQSDSSARVALHRGPRHFRAQFTPPVDGGAPSFSFELDDDAEEIEAGAAGAADAGAEGAADAGATAAADAGATALADAGATATAAAPSAPFWTLRMLFALTATLGGLAWGAFIILRKLGRWPL